MYPLSQTRTEQVLATHCAAATSSAAPPHVASQILPHAPQLFVSLVVLTSQPLAGFPSQSAKPGLQLATVQAELEHPAVPFAIAHTLPQLPQSLGLFCVLISQPSAGLWSQSAYPALQLVIVQLPAVQPAVPFASVQTFPQEPQSFTLVPVATSHPSTGSPSQFPNPGKQLATVHLPIAHPGTAFGREQAKPHAPQSLGLFCVSISQPLAGLPSQSA
jgi:hypothetical protein